MKNNRLALIKSDGGILGDLKSRNRLIRLYNRVRKSGGWRSVRDELKIKNVATVYNFAIHGTEPKNLDERKKLGLKKKCPTCKRAIKENDKPHEHKQEPEFLKFWKRLDKKIRYKIIIEGLSKHDIL
jgi:hypothetical protein